MSSELEQIRLLLDRINNAWLKGRPEDIPAELSACFDDRMVIRGGPSLQLLASDRDACIRSYTDFLQQAKVLDCTLSDPAIDLNGDSAIATYSWAMTYELNGQRYSESGHDVFVVARRDGRWLAVWRAMLPGSTQ